MDKILEINSLSIKLKGLSVVRGIDFHIDKGDVVALVGESGCGKSMTAKSIIRLLPAEAQVGGEILFQGCNLMHKSEKEMESIRGKEIGMIFQDPMSALNPTMKIGTQLIEGMRKHLKISHKECIQKAIELLEAVEISQPEQRMNQYPFELSGGMRQRVLIAMALACNPQLLIADEPTTALDVTVQAQILQLLKNIQKKWDLAILLITHDLGIVADVCNKVLVMYAGKIIEMGTPDQIFSNPKHPYTQALLRSKPSLNQTAKLQPIQGTPPHLSQLPSGCAFHPRCPHAMEICKLTVPPFFKNQSACWKYYND